MIVPIKSQPAHLLVQDHLGDDIVEFTGLMNANIEPIVHLRRAIRKFLHEDPYRYSLDEVPVFRCKFETLAGITSAVFNGEILETSKFHKNQGNTRQ